MLTAFITHPVCLKHDIGSHHPECPARLKAIEDQLIAKGLIDYLWHLDAPEVERAHLERVHATEYIDLIYNNRPKEGMTTIDGDTGMNVFTWDAAMRAAGAVVKAVELVNERKVQNAFCHVRPPGHHAERAKGGGFCLFNNVAVGAAYALDVLGLERVAIIDIDVHHGNGTEDIFKDEERVLFCSTFQHPFYPYCGAESSNHHIVNVPLKAGTNGQQYREAFETHFMPALDAFKPQMVFISAGFDAHWEDDMGSFKLVESDYAWITTQLLNVAEKHANGRLVSVLEGGYELHALGRSVVAHLKILADL